MIKENENYLVNFDNWFVAPDGKSYKAAWGKVQVMQDSFLGVKTNRISTNWYLFIGSEEKGIIAAGCQIHYACISKQKPNTEEYETEDYHEGKTVKSLAQSRIYLAQ